MQKLKEFLMIDCYAFTTVTLLNGIIMAIGEGKQELSIIFVIPIFGVTSIIAGLILVTDQLCGKSIWMRQLFRIIDVIVPVLLYGMITSGFKLGVKKIIINIIVCLLIYIIVYGLVLISWREKDQKVNERLEKMRAARKAK